MTTLNPEPQALTLNPKPQTLLSGELPVASRKIWIAEVTLTENGGDPLQQHSEGLGFRF